MKCNQSCPGIELVSPCSYPVTITITPRARHDDDDITVYRLIIQVGSVRQWPGDRRSIPGRVIPKIVKMVLDTSLLNTQQYKLRIKGKVEQSRERVEPSLTPRCSSY